jgi:gliding motility-associated-like protein
MIKNTLYKKLVLLILSLLGLNTLKAQSTVGKDFWVTFLPNLCNDTDNLKIIATGKYSCTGIVTNPRTGWSNSFSITPGCVTYINIPSAQAYDYNASEYPINKAIHVTTTDSISLYASNFEAYTFDVTNVLPTHSLGSEYIIQTYRSTSRSSGSEFSIIATEDNTEVTINLSDGTPNHSSNSPFSVRLNAGQCYQVQAPNNADLSGTTISADENKKIAVFAGNLCALVPTYGCCCDHIVEQMIPTSSWGNEFIITSSLLRMNDKVRVTTLNDNCQIRKNGVLDTTLNARETYEFEITNNTPAVYLETSEPSCVFLYFTGASYGGDNGDPSMVIINPINQKINNITFSTFNSGSTEYHFVNIVTKTDNIQNMYLDTTNISSYFTTVPYNNNFSYAKIEVNHGAHTLNCNSSDEETGFIAHIYGLGYYESYSYSAGSMVIKTPPKLIVNDTYALDYPNGFKICNNNDNNFTFDLYITYNPSSVTWDFGDGSTGRNYPITHQYNEPGNYHVSCNIYEIESGTNHLDTTLYTFISIKPTYDTTITATICQSEIYTDNGFHENQTGIYIDTLQTIDGCDSIVRLNLTVNPEYNDTIFAHICQGETYDQYGFYENETTIITQELKTELGCDSVVTLNLEVHKVYDDTIFATIREGKYYDKYGFYECMEGIYNKYLTTHFGCDSVIHLILDVIFESNLFVENCITPNTSSNNKFYIIHEKELVIEDVYIYNRVGSLIFHSPNITEPWDGKYNGEHCPQGTYVYVIYYHKEGQKERNVKTGTVLLLY